MRYRCYYLAVRTKIQVRASHASSSGWPMNTLQPSSASANTSAPLRAQTNPASAAGAKTQVTSPTGRNMQVADDSMMQALEREYGPLGDYQEAVVQQEGARRAAWLPTDGAAGAAAGDATTTLGAVEATGEAAGTASVNGAAQAAQVAGVQAAAPAASGSAVTPGAFAFSPMALAGGAAALGVLTATLSYPYFFLVSFNVTRSSE